MIHRILILSVIFLTGCSWWCKQFCPKCDPVVVEKPVYIKPPSFKIPERPPLRLLDENLELWAPENIRKLTYNIADDQTYIRKLMEVIFYYETYTLEELDTENTDQDNIEQDDSENDESRPD